MKTGHLVKICAAALLIASASVGHANTGTSAQAAENPDQQVKCRKIQVTGSLIRKGKVCRTIAEWRQLQQAGNDAARAIAGDPLCSGGECRGFEPEDVPE